MIRTTKLGNCVHFHEIENDKFKVNKISINFITKLQPETASLNAAIALILKKSCKKYTSTVELGKKLKSIYGANLDSNIMKFGGFQIINFSIAVLADKFALDNENLLNDAFEVLCDVVFEPKMENNMFYDIDVQIEKQNLIDLIENDFSDKQKFAKIKATEILFKNSPYGCYKLGTKETVQQINKNNLTQAYNNLLNNSNIHIIATGCSNFNFLKVKIERHLANLNRSNSFKFENVQFIKDKNFQPIDEHLPDELSQSKLVMAFAATTSIEYSLIPSIQNMVAIFGATPTSKLFSIVREKLNYCYYCKAFFDISNKIIWVESAVDKTNLKKAENEIINQLNEIKLKKFTNDEISEAKNWLLTNLNTISDNIGSLENFCLFQILNDSSNSIDDEIKNLSFVDFEKIVRSANLFDHVLTFTLI